MRGKIIQLAIICFACLAITACEKLAGPSPNEVLNQYLDACLKGRYEESYSYVSAADKAVKDLQSYLKENEKKNSPFTEAIVSKVSYKILSLEKSEKTATANVEITLPDFGSIFSDVMGAAFKSAFGGGDEKEMEKILAKKFESGEVPLTTKKETFNLVKEEDGWKVFLDWKAEKIKKERQAKIQALLAEAEELKKSKKLHGAVKKYEQILELDSEMVDAKEGLKETKKEIKSFEKKQAYIKKVVLYDLKARYYDTFLEKKVPGVEFKIKNKGDKTLKKVEVTVYFKDANGTIIAEEDYYPVLVTKYSFGGNNKPLKPNYIWQMERGKFYKADSVPSEWKEGSVSAKITNIEFE
ncbi:hypothetical protein EDC39_11257 [Geothermobacter ehrlichii]|uniref:Lipoprotein n=1 Tax=Geothermobacter ehrlichii TaxID=213224 RepID=A0A5D3WHR4_9BACT|nr:hypothetical protein [Geothermobacter ehrlichii]TYO96769.1 hypothetical protein EDC39_11257 [Geothermobacter ehrlichii]